MKLTLGFSPCPNDTHIFDAMIHTKVDVEGLGFDCLIEDVETLNQRALEGELEITKLSFNAWLHVQDQYELLDAGSALGRGCGPLLICKDMPTQLDDSISVAIPGHYTTANLLLSFAYPALKRKVEMRFDEIETAVIEGRVEAGVIIHENRFTYADKGLMEIADLGEIWEKKTKMPIPLGGIAVRKDLGWDLIRKIERVLKRSVKFSFDNPTSSYTFVKQHAQEMNEDVIKKHIKLYVTDYTYSLGKEGWAAVELLKRITNL